VTLLTGPLVITLCFILTFADGIKNLHVWTLPVIITPWSRVLSEKLKHHKLLKKFPAFYGTRRFITIITRVRHLSLSWATLIQPMPPSNLSKIHFNIILPSTPGSSKWSPSLRFPHYSPVCNSPLPHTCHMSCPSQSSWLDHPNDIWWGVQSIKLLVM
jgi:hypothetical protein